MALYESNYLRLLQLVPELTHIDGCYRSRVAGDCDLLVDVIERCRYTVTLSLTYEIENETETAIEPDLIVRAYLDGELAEAMSLGSEQRQRYLRSLLTPAERELHARWRRNIMLNKWLEYLSDKGHLVLNH